MDVRKFVLRIPGQWDDAWLYREQLLIWDRFGRLYSISLDEVRRAVSTAGDHHLSVLAEYLVLRSARKTMSEFRDALAIQSIKREFFLPLETHPETLVELKDLGLRPAAIEAVPGNLTDTVAYGNRLFAASDAGVYETQFDARYDDESPLLEVASTPSTAVVAGNGQVAASLGDRGLVARAVGFGDGPDWATAAEAESISLLAPYSRSVSRSSVHLLNYGEDAIPDFITAAAHTEVRANGYKENVITSFAEPTVIRDQVMGSIRDDPFETDPSDREGFEVMGNAGYRLLVRRGSEIDVLNLRQSATKGVVVQHDRRRPRVELARDQGPTIRHTLATHQLTSGFLVEHIGGAHILTDAGIIELATELAVQMRTFPNSRRYDDTVVLVREGSLDLDGFIDLNQSGDSR